MGTNHPFDLFKDGSYSRRSIIDPQSGQPVEAMLNRTWLASRPKDELVGYVLELARELKVDRRGQSTVDIPVSLEPQPPDESPAPHVVEFLRLPAESRKPRAQVRLTTWRIILTGLDSQYAPLGLELSDDVVVGRAVHGIHPDLDLMPYGAEELGVSRLHAMLRPTEAQLLLLDLDSSNGTFCNRQRCTGNTPLEVQDHDIIRFGALAFRVNIVEQPSE
jgi:hypothetical protein